MSDRKKVIIHCEWCDDRHIALTADQIRLLEWLTDAGYISDDEITYEVLESSIRWTEI